MMKFAYVRSDGAVAIVVAAAKTDVEQVLGLMSEDEFKFHVLSRSIPPEIANVYELPDSWKAPDDRTFRNAWRLGVGLKIEHDMEHAREIARDLIRGERAPRLAAFDVAYQRADEANDAEAKTRFAAAKQKLRDAPADQRIEDATDAKSLKVAMQSIIREMEI